MKDFVLGRKELFWFKFRAVIVIIGIFSMFLWIAVRAYSVQILQHRKFKELAEEQYLCYLNIPAKRGTILDRNNKELAITSIVDSVYARPNILKELPHEELKKLSQKLAEILQLDPETVFQKITSQKKFVWLKRQISKRESALIKELGIKGIEIANEGKRFYPNNNFASNLLGFVGVDGHGLEGIEFQFDKVLLGEDQLIRGIKDARGRLFFSEELLLNKPIEGNSLVLTIDRTIQYIAEQELITAINLFEAKAGSVIVLDPITGEILAMANYPTFNPNSFFEYSSTYWRNRAIHDLFEPGSTMKIFSIATGLAVGAITPSDEFFCERGKFEIFGYTVHDSSKLEWLTVTEILQKSSNIGVSKISLLIGKQTLYNYLKRFGFGEKSGILLPGELSGKLRHWKEWYDVDLITISFGQGIGVSNLQLAMATASIANGGKLMKPLIVKEIRSPKGEILERFEPEVKRIVIPRSIARTVSEMLTTVTEEGGTGKEASIDRFVVAGKTGTAQKPDLVHGGYKENSWVASFVGFVPAFEPKVLISVVIDEPLVTHYGGSVAAPVFRRIGEQVLNYMGVSPPNLLTIDQRGKEDSSYNYRKRKNLSSKGNELSFASNKSKGREPSDLSNSGDNGGSTQIKLPNWYGKSLSQVIKEAKKLGIKLDIQGSGFVYYQEPKPESYISKGETVKVELSLPSSLQEKK